MLHHIATEKSFVDNTLHYDHTLEQLEKTYQYLKKSKRYVGYLVVPKTAGKEAGLLIKSVFGDRRIRVATLR